MITSVVLENFKCFRKVEVNPRRITVFIGPNGTGKSSVLQALALLKQSVGHSQLIPQGALVNLEGSDDIVPKFVDVSEPTNLEFGGIRTYSEITAMGFDDHVRYKYPDSSLSGRTDSRSKEIEFTFEGTPIRLRAPKREDTVVIGPYKANLSHTSAIADIARVEGWPESPGMELQRTFNHLLTTPTLALKDIRLVPTTRGLVRPDYELGTEKVDDIALGEGLSHQEEQTATNLAYSRPTEHKVSEWLTQVTDVGLRVDLVPPRRVNVKALASIGDINLANEGFGTNALILLLMQLASASTGATVMIEEPEIHLHPRAQAELASLMAGVAEDEDKQIIMTTHSEHIVGRLLTLVAEKRLSPDDLAIYAFEKDIEGVCTASQLEVTEDGRVKGGVKDFFESNLDELERYIRALQPTQ